MSKQKKVSLNKAIKKLKQQHNLVVIGDENGIDRKVSKKEVDEIETLITNLENGLPVDTPAKPKKKLPTSFTNNNLIDKFINEQSGEPKRLTYDEVKPVADSKMKALEEECKTKQKAFDDKYLASEERKTVVAALESLGKKDPDVFIHLSVSSKACDLLRQKMYRLSALKLNKQLTYPADTIEKINKI